MVVALADGHVIMDMGVAVAVIMAVTGAIGMTMLVDMLVLAAPARAVMGMRVIVDMAMDVTDAVLMLVVMGMDVVVDADIDRLVRMVVVMAVAVVMALVMAVVMAVAGAVGMDMLARLAEFGDGRLRAVGAAADSTHHTISFNSMVLIFSSSPARRSRRWEPQGQPV